MKSQDAADDTTAYIEPSDFHSKAHKAVWTAIAALAKAGKGVENFTVREKLEQLDKWGKDGVTAELLVMCEASGAVAENADDYARIVQRHAAARAALRFGEELREKAGDGRLSLEQIALMVDEGASRAIERTAPVEPVHVADALDGIVAAAKIVREEGLDFFGIPTGIPALDKHLGGLRGGQLITIPGDTGVGKSFTGMAVGFSAQSSGHNTLYISAEMSREEVFARWVSSISLIPTTLILQRKIREEDVEKLEAAVEKYRDHGFHVLSGRSITTAGIRAAALRRKRKLEREGKHLGLIVVDYLHLIKPASNARYGTRNEEVAAIAGDLKDLALELNIPVIALCSLNREWKSNGYGSNGDGGRKEPKVAQIHHIRDSGAIEYDSDVIIMADELTNSIGDKEPNVRFRILKMRGGEKGAQAEVYLDHRFARFLDPETREPLCGMPDVSTASADDPIPF